ncbi:hypothetical protein D3C77_627410 [compost metagenome]
MPAIFSVSSQTIENAPATGFQWNLTKRLTPSALIRRKVCTPKPSIARKLRGIPRSDMVQSTMCADSGVSETKSQKLSCADCACGISLCGSGFTACTKSGNLMASWMKNTGMLLPTRSKLPSSV